MQISILCAIPMLLCWSPTASMLPRYQKDSVIPPQQPQQKRISMQSDLQMKRQRKCSRTCSNPFHKSRKIYNKTPIRHQNGFLPQKSHIRANKKSLRNLDFSGFLRSAPDRNRTCGLSVRRREYLDSHIFIYCYKCWYFKVSCNLSFFVTNQCRQR